MSKTYGCFSCNNPFTVPSRYSGNSILCPHCVKQNKLSNTDECPTKLGPDAQQLLLDVHPAIRPDI